MQPIPRGGGVVKQLLLAISTGGYTRRMFVFFSNRLGCFGSIVVSVVLTVVLLLVLTAINSG